VLNGWSGSNIVHGCTVVTMMLSRLFSSCPSIPTPCITALSAGDIAGRRGECVQCESHPYQDTCPRSGAVVIAVTLVLVAW
jgi:hypothetical protein